MGAGQSRKFSHGSRHSKRRQQVAAVCYRIRKCGIEFLLVQTHGGRWIFPKGGAELGLTLAQSAALEAFEEAGVHGRMEEVPFARYFRRRPDATAIALGSETELAVAAYLCEVSRLEPPQEENRNPRWFSAEKAKRRLLANRAQEFGAELARVVDRALSRIQRLHSGRQTSFHAPTDGLRRVRLEAARRPGLSDPSEAVLACDHGQRNRDATAIAVPAHWRELRQIDASAQIPRSLPRLGAGADFIGETAEKVTALGGDRSAKRFEHVKVRRTRGKGRVSS
jgi:8-oxo-dGTP pyrophosphatase MutT (NUDIX family)